MTLDAGISRVLNAADNDDDFVLIVESTDAAYVSSRPPGCSLTAADQTTPVAEYRFVVASNASSSSLLQRLDVTLAALHHTAVIKHLYYKWWTSTDCLAHFIDPNVWTLDHDAEDVDETSDDDRIFFRSPVSAARAEPPQSSTTRDRPERTQVDDDELDRGEMLASEPDEQSHISQRPVRGPVHVTATAGSRDIITDNGHRQRHTQSLVASSTSDTTTSATLSWNPTTTTTTTTTKLPRRSHREPDDDVDDKGHSPNIDEDQRNYDESHLIASTVDTTDKDRFDYVFVTHGPLSAHVEDYYDDDNEQDSDGLVSEQQMAVKEHLRSGGGPAIAGDARQLPSTTTKRARDMGGQRTTVTGGSDGTGNGCVVNPPSMTLLLVVSSLLVIAAVTDFTMRHRYYS